MKNNKTILRKTATSFLLFLICAATVFAGSPNENQTPEGEIIASIDFDPKVKPNEAYFRGSGKKYKKCHGAGI